MSKSDIEYLQSRAEEELDRADACQDQAVEQVHRRMAMLYAAEVRKLDNQPTADSTRPTSTK